MVLDKRDRETLEELVEKALLQERLEEDAIETMAKHSNLAPEDVQSIIRINREQGRVEYYQGLLERLRAENGGLRRSTCADV